jgi:hypothetical protein
MGKELYYNYDCEKVGKLKKMLTSVVMIEEDWINHVNQTFGTQGYSSFLNLAQKLIRNKYAEQLTDAQAWILMHHVLTQGVPLALQDTSADEETNPALFIPKKAASMTAGAVDTTLEATGKVVSGVAGIVTAPFKRSSSDDERDENGAPTDSPP